MDEIYGKLFLLKMIGALSRIRLEPRTRQVLDLIITKCYDRPEVIPHSKFEEVTGLTITNVSRAISHLIKYNIINRTQVGRGYIYSIQPKTELWMGEPEKSTTTGHAEFVDYFCIAYKKKFGINYAFNGGRDGKLAKALLKTFELEDLKPMVDAFFDEDDEFLKKAGKTISLFSVKANTMAQRIRGVDEPKLFGKFEDEPGPAGF